MKRKYKLKKERIKEIILNCSGEKNYSTEHLWIIGFKDNKIIGITKIDGGKRKTFFSNSDIRRRLRMDNTKEFILIHNHPSGNAFPTRNDLKTIKHLDLQKKRGLIMRDFLIFSEKFIYSFEWNKNLPKQGPTYNLIFW
ncbi:MAG: hypothetical protein KAX49_14000 [Halanaerobiales bacterium]|nr:hypothetical protein [Halanaerobiales bacterium]